MRLRLHTPAPISYITKRLMFSFAGTRTNGRIQPSSSSASGDSDVPDLAESNRLNGLQLSRSLSEHILPPPDFPGPSPTPIISTSNNDSIAISPSPPATTQDMQAISPLTLQDEFLGGNSLVIARPSWQTLYDVDGTQVTGVPVLDTLLQIPSVFTVPDSASRAIRIAFALRNESEARRIRARAAERSLAQQMKLWKREVERAEEEFSRVSNGVDSFVEQVRRKVLGLDISALEAEELGWDADGQPDDSIVMESLNADALDGSFTADAVESSGSDADVSL
ncbi:hypothetical protein BV25DRAFT_1928689 [Artomyces pyxidatus]|uniref:Uncharacterized protein n=1 Tax=Artomyces pyxidatus TaxID=48021 RepID=A0ACB8SHP2_9AGAM|nr:hypothetical protein BV25DRAFT_1928689 [Artomyces pyxidatus]